MPKRNLLQLPFCEILADALRWPEYRVSGYKKALEAAKKIGLSGWRGDFHKILRDIATNGRVLKLSDDLVWAMVKISLEADPIWLYEQALAARMPFGVTVFEFNALKKYHMFREMGATVESLEPGDYPLRAFQTVQTDINGRRVVSSSAIGDKDPGLVFFPLGTVICEGPGCDVNLMVPFFTDTAALVEWMYTKKIMDKCPGLVERITEDGLVTAHYAGPISSLALLSVAKGNPHRAEQIIKSGTGGDFRMFGALCSLLNRPATVRYSSESKGGGGPTLERSEPMPIQEQSCTLMLPRERVVSLVLKPRVPRGPLVEAHEVDPHWCYSHRRGDVACQHKWPSAPTRRQVCEKCNALRWWRHIEKRGPGDVKVRKERRLDFSGVTLEKVLSDG